MGNLPLHPAIVHLPVGLAFVLPVVAALALLLALRGENRRTGYLFLVTLELLALSGALVALKTGEQAEETAERVVSERLIGAHEEKAELFTVLAGVSLALGLASLAVANKPAALKVVGALALAATIAAAVQAIRTGHAGGELVYRYGAASAYVSRAGAPGGEAGAALLKGEAGKGESEEDEDD